MESNKKQSAEIHTPNGVIRFVFDSKNRHANFSDYFLDGQLVAKVPYGNIETFRDYVEPISEENGLPSLDFIRFLQENKIDILPMSMLDIRENVFKAFTKEKPLSAVEIFSGNPLEHNLENQ